MPLCWRPRLLIQLPGWKWLISFTLTTPRLRRWEYQCYFWELKETSRIDMNILQPPLSLPPKPVPEFWYYPLSWQCKRKLPRKTKKITVTSRSQNNSSFPFYCHHHHHYQKQLSQISTQKRRLSHFRMGLIYYILRASSIEFNALTLRIRTE